MTSHKHIYRCSPNRPHQVVREDGACDDESLARLQAINSSKDVNAVGTKDGQGHHVSLRI